MLLPLTFYNYIKDLFKKQKLVDIFTYCLVFFTSRTPEQCPSVVSLLSESYNPHVRFGAAMALGIACAGTGLKVSLVIIHM